MRFLYLRVLLILHLPSVHQVPFTFDELPDGHLEDEELVELANKETSFEPEDLYRSSFYLIDEEVHPCLFPVDLENPEDMPDDEVYYYDEEDLMG